MEISREQVLRFRVHVQQLDREPGGTSTAPDVLDLGVQDTGPDGARWALVLRGHTAVPDDLFTVWSLRGAPHVYRRAQAEAVAAAVAPFSEADAAKRVFTAARPLKKAGIPVLDALDRIANEMRSIVTSPTVKGDLSSELHARLPEPYQRYCQVCDAVHLYEQPFRFSALRAGLELRPGTSPLSSSGFPAGAARPPRSSPRCTRSVLRSICSARSRPSRSRPTSTRPSRT